MPVPASGPVTVGEPVTLGEPVPSEAQAPSEEPVSSEQVATAFAEYRMRDLVPALQQEIGGKPLVYLDSAASTLRPLPVLEAIDTFERTAYSNVHRGVHTLSQRATQAFEEARAKVADFVGVKDNAELVFVRGTTEAINLVAQTHGRMVVNAGDEVLVSEMEHHSNLVPWQMLCAEKDAKLVKIPLMENGDLDLKAYQARLNSRTKVVAVTHVSNVLGTRNPLEEMIPLAHAVGATVVVDGAQAVPHLAVDLAALNCDFYAFSGHKFYGPSGIGALWGRRALLEEMPPWQGGGSMIRTVSFSGTEWNELPYKFEAGTPNITGAVGMAAAVDFLSAVGLEAASAREGSLLEAARDGLIGEGGVRVLGDSKRRTSVVSFLVEGVHAHDVGQILDQEGVAVRVGHHCAQPIMDFYGTASTTRASFGVYNKMSDVERLLDGVRTTKAFFGV